MRNLLSFFVLTTTFVSQAQWDINPTNPAAVSNEVGHQNSPQTYPDGAGGLYVLWLDARVSSSSRDVYGQHYNAQGEILWEPQGREILNLEKDIAFFRFYRYGDGKMFLVWYENSDLVLNNEGVFVNELNDEGQIIWPESLKMSEESTQGPLSVGNFLSVQLVRHEDSFLVMMNIQTYGYLRMRVTTFDTAGELTGPFNGTEIGPLSFGWAVLTPDHAGGAYVYYSTGNGWGAGLMVNRLSPSGQLLWPQWVAATAGTPGLGYQFTGVGLDNGVMLVWEINQTDIIAQRLDTLGNAFFDPYLPICTAPGTQNGFQVRRKGNELTAVWRDARPGVNGTYAVYGQRFTPAGEMLWATDGIEIANIGSGDPNVVFNYADDESIVVFHHTSATGPKEHVQKIYPDGSRGYGDNGIVIAEGSNFTTSDTQKSILMTGTNIVAVWRAWTGGPTAENIHISLVENLITFVTEDITACNEYTVSWEEQDGEMTIIYSETLAESGTYQFYLPGDTLLTINLTILDFVPQIIETTDGLLATPEGADYVWIDCFTGGSLSEEPFFVPQVSGSYAVTVSNEICSVMSDCVDFTFFTVVDSSLTVCDAYLLDGVLITESGLYELFLPGDTILNLNLTIETLFAGVTQVGNTLVYAPADATLVQWIDCDTGEAVSTSPTFQLTQSGNYACVLERGPCTSTSDCIGAQFIGIREMDSSELEVFPNPWRDALFVQWPHGPADLHLMDATGRVVYAKRLSEHSMHTIALPELAPGLYVLHVQGTQHAARKAVIKE